MRSVQKSSPMLMKLAQGGGDWFTDHARSRMAGCKPSSSAPPSASPHTHAIYMLAGMQISQAENLSAAVSGC